MLLRPSFALAAHRRARVEIIPLIDVVFFLMATFVLLTLSLDKTQALEVILPRGGEPQGDLDPVTLQVTTPGAAYWNGELMEVSAVPGRLAAYKVIAREPRVLLAGDEHARWGDVVALLDAVRRAGIAQYTIETRPRPPGR